MKTEEKKSKFKGKIYRGMYCPTKREYMDMMVIENNGNMELKFGDFFKQTNIRLKDKKNSVQKELLEMTEELDKLEGK